jgi:hypothetical protein
MPEGIDGIPSLGLPGASAFAGFQAALAAQKLLASHRLASTNEDAPAIAEPRVNEFFPQPLARPAPAVVEEVPQPVAQAAPVLGPPSASSRPAQCTTISQATVCFQTPEHNPALRLFSEVSLAGWGGDTGSYNSHDPVEICVQDKPRVILLFGYWPPTDIGIQSRRGMLWKWRDWQRNYKNSGFDVIAISPTFAAQIGWDDAARTSPFWGKGDGQLRVDYDSTSRDFWNLVRQHNPIAILSFSRGAADKSWEFEALAKNRRRAEWTTSLPYRDNTGALAAASPMIWAPPSAGGTRGDHSPFKFRGPKPGDPPDPTENAGFLRRSNLPMVALKESLERRITRANLVPEIDDNPAGRLGGTFVSEYMSYHVNWYRDYTQQEFANDPDKQCWYAGHTHVGIFVHRLIAERAVEIQLDHIVQVMVSERKLGLRKRK